jgi:hypothetical protein
MIDKPGTVEIPARKSGRESDGVCTNLLGQQTEIQKPHVEPVTEP